MDNLVRKIMKEPHSELEIQTFDMAVDIFKKDLRFMIQVFETKADENNDLENHPNLKKSMYFRGLLYLYKKNRHTTPLPIIMRPAETKDVGMQYETGITMFHDYIYDKWKEIATNHTKSPRAKVLKELQNYGGYDELEHIYFYLEEDLNGKITMKLDSEFLNKKRKIDRTGKKELIEQLNQYGFDEISHHGNIISIETIILKDMLSEKIERDTKKLKAILTPMAISQYKRLALKFLTNPEPNKASKAFQIFQRYQELLEKL